MTSIAIRSSINKSSFCRHFVEGVSLMKEFYDYKSFNRPSMDRSLFLVITPSTGLLWIDAISRAF